MNPEETDKFNKCISVAMRNLVYADESSAFERVKETDPSLNDYQAWLIVKGAEVLLKE